MDPSAKLYGSDSGFNSAMPPLIWGFRADSGSKESACDARQICIPGLGRPPGEGNGYPVQYSCLENSKDRGVRQATVHGVAKNRTGQSDLTLSLFLQAERSALATFADVQTRNREAGRFCTHTI